MAKRRNIHTVSVARSGGESSVHCHNAADTEHAGVKRTGPLKYARLERTLADALQARDGEDRADKERVRFRTV
jgi:hypothetical protein